MRYGSTTLKSAVTVIDGTVATLGDNAYASGTLAEYQDCYDPSWGQFNAHHAQRGQPRVLHGGRFGLLHVLRG